jgi:hypothetical protein
MLFACGTLGRDWYSRFLRAPFQFSKRAAGEATEFSRSRVELLSVIGAARLECGKPARDGEWASAVGELANKFGGTRAPGSFFGASGRPAPAGLHLVRPASGTLHTSGHFAGGQEDGRRSRGQAHAFFGQTSEV